MVQSLAVDVLVAVGIGALVGIEREASESAGVVAGSRTFPLVALLGALTRAFFPDALWVALLALALPITAAYVARVVVEGDLGTTTPVALLLTFVFGAMATHSADGRTLAVTFGAVTTVLLAAKGPIHAFAEGIDPEERRATAKFAIVALVVLPLLPDEEVDWLLGLNPRFVWLMVVFISGLSLLAYVLTKFLGAERGIGLTGVLGGFVSSTATAVTMAGHARQAPDLSRIAAAAIAVASITMFPRMLLEVAVVNRGLLPALVVPVGAMTVLGLVLSGVLFWYAHERGIPDVELDNPFRVRPAIVFGAFFAVILLVSEQASASYGARGVYVTALVSGLADVDAITLSLSRLAEQGAVSESVATTGIVLGAVSNTLVKAGIAWALGTRRLGVLVTAVLGVAAGVGVVVVFV